jgi:hypothetical protein
MIYKYVLIYKYYIFSLFYDNIAVQCKEHIDHLNFLYKREDG